MYFFFVNGKWASNCPIFIATICPRLSRFVPSFLFSISSDHAYWFKYNQNFSSEKFVHSSNTGNVVLWDHFILSRSYISDKGKHKEDMLQKNFFMLFYVPEVLETRKFASCRIFCSMFLFTKCNQWTRTMEQCMR